MSFSVVLFDNTSSRDHLLPLVATRPIGNLRVGIFTLNEKWTKIFQTTVSYLTVDYLSSKFPLVLEENTDLLILNSGLLPDIELVEVLKGMSVGERLIDVNGVWIAIKVKDIEEFQNIGSNVIKEILYENQVNRLVFPEDIFLQNSSQIDFDIEFSQVDNNSYSIDSSNIIFGDSLYISESCNIKGVTIDSRKGPICIGDNSVIEPGVVIYGHVSIGRNCRVKSGTVIYSNVSIGDNSTVCGELNNVVIWGNSAKGHLGYLGCSVLGEGCNLGAGTNNSNLRNDWNSVKIYDYHLSSFRDTGLVKCGVIIGDQVMLAIGSKINTGTVIGVGSQIAMSKFIPKFVPDFSWITDEKSDRYIFERFEKMLQRKSKLKNEVIGKDEVVLFKDIYINTKK